MAEAARGRLRRYAARVEWPVGTEVVVNYIWQGFQWYTHHRPPWPYAERVRALYFFHVVHIWFQLIEIYTGRPYPRLQEDLQLALVQEQFQVPKKRHGPCPPTFRAPRNSASLSDLIARNADNQQILTALVTRSSIGRQGALSRQLVAIHREHHEFMLASTRQLHNALQVAADHYRKRHVNKDCWRDFSDLLQPVFEVISRTLTDLRAHQRHLQEFLRDLYSELIKKPKRHSRLYLRQIAALQPSIQQDHLENLVSYGVALLGTVLRTLESGL